MQRYYQEEPRFNGGYSRKNLPKIQYRVTVSQEKLIE